MIKAGKLRHRVRFEKRVELKNETGEEIILWTPIVIVDASIEPLRGRELLAAHEVASQVTHRVLVRYYPGIEAAHRINLGKEDRYLNIQSPINLEERNREIEILAIEGKGDFGPVSEVS